MRWTKGGVISMAQLTEVVRFYGWSDATEPGFRERGTTGAV